MVILKVNRGNEYVVVKHEEGKVVVSIEDNVEIIGRVAMRPETAITIAKQLIDHAVYLLMEERNG